VAKDFSQNADREIARRTPVIAGKRHHQWRKNKVQCVIETEYQGDRHRSWCSESENRQRRSHVTNIAILGGETLDRAFIDLSRPYKCDKKHCQKDAECRRCATGDECPLRQFGYRRIRKYLEKQGRKRHITMKVFIHPSASRGWRFIRATKKPRKINPKNGSTRLKTLSMMGFEACGAND
jgi:hypothetical protein